MSRQKTEKKPKNPRGLRPREGNWHYRFKVNGQEYTGNTGFAATPRHVNDALAARAKERTRILTGGPPAPTIYPFSKAANEFLDYNDGEHRDKPQTAYRTRTSFASLCAYFGNEPVQNIRPAEIEGYKSWRRKAFIQDITIRHDLHNLSLLFQYATKRGWSSGNPVREVDIPSDKTAERAYILNDAEEVAYFAEALMSQPTLHDVTRLMILQGCRPEEIMALEQKNISLTARSMKITRGKSSAARRSLRLLPESMEILRKRLSKHNTWVFPSPRYFGRHITKLNRQHEKVCQSIGLDIVIYDFRHTWATRMAMNGCPLPMLAKLMGHSNLRSVMRYVHIDEESTADAMERYGHNKVDGASTFRPPKRVEEWTDKQNLGEKRKA